VDEFGRCVEVEPLDDSVMFESALSVTKHHW